MRGWRAESVGHFLQQRTPPSEGPNFATTWASLYICCTLLPQYHAAVGRHSLKRIRVVRGAQFCAACMPPSVPQPVRLLTLGGPAQLPFGSSTWRVSQNSCVGPGASHWPVAECAATSSAPWHTYQP